MIRELRLINWKSFTDAILYVDELTFVIGTNASGKSNLLDAFYCLSRLAQGKPIGEVVNGIRGGQDWFVRDGQSNAKLSIVVAADIKAPTFLYEIYFEKRKSGIEITGESLINSKNGRRLFWTNEVSEGSPTIDARFYTAKRGNPRRIDLARTTCILSQIDSLNIQKEVKQAASVVLQNLTNVFILNPIPNNMRGYAPLSSILLEDASNIAGVLAGMEEPIRKTVEGIISKYLRPLPERDINKVWTETVGRFGKDAMLYCEEEWVVGKKTVIDSRGMSDGTLRFIAIITALMTMPMGNLLIVEEIDNGLHPSRVKELIIMLQTLGHDRGIDVLCTTHNPVLIDELGGDMLPFIAYIKRDSVSGGSIIELLEDKPNLAKLMAQHSAGDLMVEDML